MLNIPDLPMPYLLVFLLIIAHTSAVFGQSGQTDFEWPDGKKAAVSLTFDDARPSQVKKGTVLLDKWEAKATFYVVPGAVEREIEGWEKAVANGHEIGNHTVVHPCSGNFVWSRDRALETYTLGRMKSELVQANRRLEELLGVKPTSFAYPCGQTTVGRGVNTMSYVPLIAELFDTGRGWLDEAPNDPTYVDMAQLTGIEMDGKDFDEILPYLETAKENGSWLVLSGHEMDEAGRQTTRLSMLDQLIPYLQDPANGFWLARVDEVTRYVLSYRMR